MQARFSASCESPGGDFLPPTAHRPVQATEPPVGTSTIIWVKLPKPSCAQWSQP